MDIPIIVIKNLEFLGAKFEITDDGLILLGDFKNCFTPYHKYFVEIKGALYKVDEEFYSPFNHTLFPNLKRLGYLYTDKVVQHPGFLYNLENLKVLYTDEATQHPDFLINLKSLKILFTNKAVQHPDFLRNIKELEEIYTHLAVQEPGFLRNLKSIGTIHSKYVNQHLDFLRKIIK